ncbi:hypothetical protein ACIGB6_13975 [Paeniglutamicibacter gangotriensis]|uniref:hypothetical protein n=1 Tax=Paeniglutamicibacter gangotriensis TaxID=254787 RepID=UPI0037CB4049
MTQEPTSSTKTNYLSSPEWEAFYDRQEEILNDPYMSAGEKSDLMGYGAPEETWQERVARDNV